MNAKPTQEYGTLLVSLGAKHYLPIGAFLSRWATLEYSAQNIIWLTIGLSDEEGRVLTIGMGTQPILGILRNIKERMTTDSEVKEKIGLIIEGISHYKEFRNHLAHGVWSHLESNPVPHLTYMKAAEERFIPTVEPITPEQIATAAEDIFKFINICGEVITKLRKDIPTA